MSDTYIGIKIADGTFYPVLKGDEQIYKRLVLTTARDDQDSVQIDLYRGYQDTGPIEDAQYVGSLIIENIELGKQGDPDINLILGVDEEGVLKAEADNEATGESQSFSISLKTLKPDQTFELPDFHLDEISENDPVPPAPDLEESPALEEPEEEPRRSKTILLAGFVFLGLLVILLSALLVFQLLNGEETPPLTTDGTGTAYVQPDTDDGKDSSSPEGGSGSAGESAKEAGTPEQKTSSAEISEKAASEKPALETTPEGLYYRIKWGDTLWDLSLSFYRTPWRYLQLARTNNISDPDLIYAGSQLFIPKQ